MTTVAGRTIAHVDHGGDGPPVVLLHSFLMDGEMFAPQVRDLGAEYRLITVDERGHGGTPADGPFDYWDVARDVLAVLDHLGIDRAAVVGTSQGGFIGLRMALLAPERVTALAVLGSSADAEDPQVAAVYRQLRDGWRANGPAEELLDTVSGICLGTTEESVWKQKWRTVDGERFAQILDVLVDRDSLLDRLGEVRCPVLVMHGTADAAYPVAKAQEIADGVPHAEFETVEGGFHFLSLTDADAVTPRLRTFLAGSTR